MQIQPSSMTQGRCGDLPKAWCVAEYTVAGEPGAPPVPMMIAAVRLCDAFTFAEPKRNSEWRKCITDDHFVGVFIHATGTMQECRKHATKMIMARNPRPRCNVYGFNSFSLARPLNCSNGQQYENQADAARLLNLSAGAISRHLKGELRAVKGYTFAYKD